MGEGEEEGWRIKRGELTRYIEEWMGRGREGQREKGRNRGREGGEREGGTE